MEEHKKIEELFVAALDLEPQEQGPFLAGECAGHPAILAKVKSLLEADAQAEAESFMRQPALEVQAHQIARELAETRSVQAIGRYQLLDLIGEGGMGEVYLALDQELDRKVAVKLIKGNFKTQELLRRFNNERQILAHLNHANIAGLLDGGTTDDGIPFFVMEHVEGEPIDRYADEHQLSITDRLKLFRTVCEAVQYAHQHLVIHRDLKPTNILVTSEGDPKLLDFGIAKLLLVEDAAATDETAAVFRVMTPEYASPEQVKGEPITTATDVYSLGVVLYELLTGQRPHKFKSRQPADIAEAICIREPDKPSQASSGQLVSNKSVKRANEVEAIPQSARWSPRPGSQAAVLVRNPKSLRGDLDNIVLMAMRKDPLRRYTSVGQLSEDIARHLDGLPVIARTDTFTYRASKFIKRNKVAVPGAAVILIVLIGGIIATAWEAHVARTERAKAEQRFNEVREMAHAVMFDYHDAVATLPGSTPVRERMVRDSLTYLDKLAQQGGDNRALQREIASAYLKVGDVQGHPYRANLGDTKGALVSYRKALAVLEVLVKADSNDVESLLALSVAHENIGLIQARAYQWTEAIENQSAAMTIRDDLVASSSNGQDFRALLSDSYFNFADAMMFSAGKYDSARALENDRIALKNYRKSLSIREPLSDREPANIQLRRDVAQSYQRIGIVMLAMYDNSGKPGGSKRLVRIATTPNQISGAEYLPLALESHDKSLAIRKALYIAQPTSAQARRDLADEYVMRGDAQVRSTDFQSALEGYRQALPIFESLLAADPLNTEARRDLALAYQSICLPLAELGDAAEALDNYRKSARLFEAMFKDDPTNGEDRNFLIQGYQGAGELLEKMGHTVEALEQNRRALAIFYSLRSEHPADAGDRQHLMYLYETIGDLLLKMGDKGGASKNYRKVLALVDSQLNSDSPNSIVQYIAYQYMRIGNAYLAVALRGRTSVSERQDTWREARDWYQKSLAIWQDMKSKGTLGGADASMPADLAKEIAKCDVVLGR